MFPDFDDATDRQLLGVFCLTRKEVRLHLSRRYAICFKFKLTEPDDCQTNSSTSSQSSQMAFIYFFLWRYELIKMIQSFYEFKYNRRTSDYDSHANIDCPKNIKKI